jgi:hypothetical protein
MCQRCLQQYVGRTTAYIWMYSSSLAVAHSYDVACMQPRHLTSNNNHQHVGIRTLLFYWCSSSWRMGSAWLVLRLLPHRVALCVASQSSRHQAPTHDTCKHAAPTHAQLQFTRPSLAILLYPVIHNTSSTLPHHLNLHPPLPLPVSLLACKHNRTQRTITL